MMLGLGAGAWLPAVFHIFTHAFFKACLFLGAGSISHSASHHSFDMKRDMGGLRKAMPVTFATWTVSTLALCGVFPFSGFFSKDEIIDNVGNNGYQAFMVVGLVGAFLTAAYMTRATYLTFFGSPRGASAGDHGHDDHGHDGHTRHDDHAGHGSHTGPRESGPLITVPLVLLATLAIGSGFLNATPFGSSWERLKDWVEPRPAVVEVVAHGGPGESRAMASEEGHAATPCGTEAPESGVCYAPALEHAKFRWSKALLSLAIVFAGIAISWLLSVAVYARKMRPFAGLTARVAPLRWLHALLVNKYFLDALYERVVVRAVAGPIARAAYWFNQRVIDGILHAVASISRAVSGWLYRNVDQRVVDGAVNASGRATRGAGGAVQPIQSGKVSQYGALLFAAAAVAALVLVIVNI